MKGPKYYFLVVDIGFITYWGITSSGAIPDALLFKDYADPIMVAWNWSFLPLDLCNRINKSFLVEYGIV
jgi:hypothetical protein|tara:strand:- start:140 stop:346 length:207 start_codon:yes stop_codon:yes gene_type:complete